MVFSSSIFLIWFLPIFLIVYQFLPNKLKNYFILISSIFFYSWGAPKFLFILMASTILDFYIVKGLYNATKLKIKKRYLALSISMNLGLLLYFKYANFFIENVNFILNSFGIEQVGWTKVILPIGISFYTFQTLTYSIDVYRKLHAPLSRLTDYLLYIMSFPQMIAGPIVKYNQIADQIINRTNNVDDKLVGFVRFSIGLAKKILIANVMGEQADLILNQSAGDLTSGAAWIGILAYTFQIYFDFSGYSDMAIGLGKMMNFTFPENFNSPYASGSISEFWRRWHMTLGQWMKDYLYIPLGGNKVNTIRRLYFNLWFVFLVSGLWHGASWNFVLWGAYHGFFLILDRLFLLRFYKKIGKIPSVLITFFIVAIGWVFFRIEDFSDAIELTSKLFEWKTLFFNNSKLVTGFLFYLTIAIFFSFVTVSKPGSFIEKKVFHTNLPKKNWLFIMLPIGVILFVISLATLTTSGFNPFIYFRF